MNEQDREFLSEIRNSLREPFRDPVPLGKFSISRKCARMIEREMQKL